SGTTTYVYDVNGSQTSSTNNTVNVTIYGYDLRNRMTSVTVNGILKGTYVYDDAGDRVQETASGVTTYYLTDTENPTGYAKPMEERSSPTGSANVTYLIGNRVFGQASNTGTLT